MTRSWRNPSHGYYSDDKRSILYLSIISKACPPPLATQVNGSSATITGMPVEFEINLSKSLNSAPPPVKTMPLSAISAASSGGDSSKAFRIALTIPYYGSFIASKICSLFIEIVSGIPSAKFLPVIDISIFSDSAVAHPIVYFIFSAVDSPITHP